MRKMYLFKTFLLLCALIVGAGSSWAETITYSFNSKSWEAKVGDIDANWTSGKDGAGFSNNGVQVTSSVTGANATSPTSLTDISKIVVTYNTNKSAGAGTLGIKIGSNEEVSKNWAYSGSADGRVANFTLEYDYATPQTGNVKITATTQTNSIYVVSIAITYTDTSDTRTAVNMTSFTALKTTLLAGETTETSVANDQNEWNAVYTYSSDNEDVATISTSGVITAKAKGTANITATLNVNSDDANFKAGSTKSKSIGITVNNPCHNVTFYTNGAIYDKSSVEEGDDVVFPSSLSSLGGKVFVGWVPATIDGTTDVSPSFVSSATMGKADLFYYAVYATAEGTLVRATDELTNDLIGASGSNYKTWSKLTDQSEAVYAGNSAGGNTSSPCIQLRSKNSESGIVSTTSAGKVKKITVVWDESTTNARKLDIYGSNTAYTSAENLYSNSKGTLIGSLTGQTDTELSISDDYAYIGLRSNDGAIYVSSISITWENGSVSYSDYCTTVTVSKEVTSNGYASYVTPDNVEFPAGRAFVVTDATNNVKLSEVTSVPAGTPVILKTQGTVIANVLNVTPDAPATNLLTIGNETIPANKDAYVLAKDGDSAGFKLWIGDESVLEGRVVLLLDKVVGARDFISFDEGETTGLKAIDNGQMTIDNIYDLSGRKIANGKFQKGLYIVNGRKVVIK